MTRHSGRIGCSRFWVALVTLFAFTVTLFACSTRNDSLPALGTEEDYLARRENTSYPFGYGPYDFCAAYDPYCFEPYWYSVPIYYLSPGGGDNDCDDGRCGDPGKGSHDKRATDSPHRFGAVAAPARLAHFGPLFVAGGFRGHGRR
jgi:hypothetical protein